MDGAGRMTAALGAALPLAATFKLESDSILRYLLVGLVVGVVARFLVRGSAMSFVITLVIGVIGAMLGDWLAGNFFEETPGVDWLASILAAVILVWIYTSLTARRRFGFRRRRLI